MADLIKRQDALMELITLRKDNAERSCENDIMRGKDIAYENAMDIIARIPAVNRWISVEDALPEIKEFHISDTVLCYCDSGALAIARLEENGFGQVGFNCEKDDGYNRSTGKVLFYMPIPEIPEPNKAERINDE